MMEIKLLALAFAIGTGTVLNTNDNMLCSWDVDEELEMEILQDQIIENAEFLNDFQYEAATHGNDTKELEVFETYVTENYKNYLELDITVKDQKFSALKNKTVVCIGK